MATTNHTLKTEKERKGKMKEETKGRIWLNHWWGKIILNSIFIGVGVGMYFYARSILISSEQEYLLPFLYIGLPIAFSIGVLIVIFETRLMSVGPIKTMVTFFKPAVTFFKRTKFFWLLLLLGTAIALAFVNRGI